MVAGEKKRSCNRKGGRKSREKYLQPTVNDNKSDLQSDLGAPKAIISGPLARKKGHCSPCTVHSFIELYDLSLRLRRHSAAFFRSLFCCWLLPFIQKEGVLLILAESQRIL